MPTGGGAIRGVGEKFAANPVTGSATFSIPIPASAGRAGFGPQLTLSYDSGSGNGPFGFGWSLALPSITRKTDRGLPLYSDATDTFLISGAADLVPVLNAAGDIEDDHESVAGYAIRRYRPRTEGLFARIERWTRDDGDTHWRSISSDNVLTVYGRDDTHRIADPADRSHVFSWLISEIRDDTGNAVIYDYVPEDGEGLDLSQTHERNRGSADDPARSANRYVSRVRYGNATTLLDSTTLRRPQFLDSHEIDATRWMFEIAFDYGDSAPADPDHIATWTRRNDPFSTHRAGFEVRTYRLCRRVLVFHNFPDDPVVGDRCLVRSLDLSYRTNPQRTTSSDPGYSFLQSATQWTHQRNGTTWHRRATPPVEFSYSEATIDDHVRDVDPATLENLPVGLGSGYLWIDLDGEGLAGVLTEQRGSWTYASNLGSGPDGPRFGPTRPVAARPNVASLRGGRQQLMDVRGNGVLDLVDLNRPLPGFQERDADSWKPFVPFEQLPNIDWNDPNLRFIDLTGDGHTDALITEQEVFTWYPSLADRGFGAVRRTTTTLDERHGPRVVFADGEQAMYVADMSGDGLVDIVRIRNGHVCYWPNLGHGRFGRQVVMDESPWFDHPDQFDQQRIRLADVDGSGTTDLLYLGRDGATLWFNRSGNTWSASRRLPFPVATTNVEQIQVADLLGNGTACLVWSSDLPADARQPMRYLDLMGGRKPHLLVEMRNNLGAVTTVEYAPSTKFYLQDQAAGTPWVTKLPFPVHCVEKVTVNDLRRRTTFANSYTYHHGFFDGVEREFCCFGRVEQIDTQRFDEVSAANNPDAGVTAGHDLYQAPVKTITWFHTGVAHDRSRILGLFDAEYFPARFAGRLPNGGFAECELSQPDVDGTIPGLTADEWREAVRACRGRPLRQEIVELDTAALDDHDRHVPTRLFSTAQHNCQIRCLQRRGVNQHSVFLVTESESVTYHYELDLRGDDPLDPDPRVAHSMNLRFDDYGRVLQSVAAAYPRSGRYTDETDDSAPPSTQRVDMIRAVQRYSHVAYTDTTYTDELAADSDTHRLPGPCDVKTFELTGIVPPTGKRYFTRPHLRSTYRLNATSDTRALIGVEPLAYHEHPHDTAPHKRLVERVVTRYYDDDLSGTLAFGQSGRLGVTYETYKLALTERLLDDVFATSSIAQDDFSREAKAALDNPAIRPGFWISGYQTDVEIFGTSVVAATPTEWWMRSGVAGFSNDAMLHFCLAERYVDPFGNETTLTYDADDLFVTSSVDPVGNTSTIEVFDRRVLAPSRLVDHNDNVSEAAFDVRGLPVATALLGKATAAGSETGDSVAGLTFDDLNPSPDDVARFFESQPADGIEAEAWRDQARAWLGQATERFVYHFGETYEPGSPVWGATAAGACSIVREQHERDAANAVVALQLSFGYSDGAGQTFVYKVQAEPDSSIVDGPTRWIANGKTIINNKGKPVLQYEPYFSSSNHRFDEPTAEGVTSVMCYDSVGRLVRTEFPDGTVSRAEFTPWFSRTFDQNDTVLEPNNRWYAEHGATNASSDDRRAARLVAFHASTPAEVHFDSLGRSVVAVAHNCTPSDTPAHRNTPLIDRPWLHERIVTFTKLDAEGKPLWIRDARQNLVMQYVAPAKANDDPSDDLPSDASPGYDIAGNLLVQHGMDTGARRMLTDAAGEPMLAWDYNERMDATTTTMSKEHRRFESRYDALHRPTEHVLRVRDEVSGTVESFAIERFRYGEGVDADKTRNVRGQLWQHYDASGVMQIDANDLSGKPRCVRRRLASEVESPAIDWTGREVGDVVVAAVGFDPEVFTERTAYDALGRVTHHYNWHVESPTGSGHSERVAVYVPTYNQRGLLNSEQLFVRARKTPNGHDEITGTTRRQQAITRITYNARGQELELELGNGTITRSTYTEDTFRLEHLYTRRDDTFIDDCAGNSDAERPPRPCGVQNLHYTYDPVGNVVHIRDDAQQTIFFANQQVEPSNDYVYDALGRLIECTGRENAAAVGAPAHREGTWPTGAIPSPDATRNYTQRYRYDRVGNIEQIQHIAPTLAGQTGSWTRYYETAPDSNRLMRTWCGDPDRNSSSAIDTTDHRYDTHGNMLDLPGAAGSGTQWDAADMIQTIDLGGGGRAWYQYGADKERCRKRIVRNAAANGTLREERICLGSYELYRRYVGDPNDPIEEIESHHLFDGDRRVLLVDDVVRGRNPRSDGSTVTATTLWRYQYSNHLGSAGTELDEAASVISHEEFHPYGTSAYRLMASATEAPRKRYRYTGVERDDESGLSCHVARYYMCSLGRWTSGDPSWDPSRLNTYCYASCAPTALIDVNGCADRLPRYIDKTRPEVPHDWKPPDLNTPINWPLSNADFLYRFKWHDEIGENEQRREGRTGDFLLPHFSITRERELETPGQFWMGTPNPDIEKVYKNGMTAPDGRHIMQEGLWYPVEMWRDLEIKRGSLFSDAPKALSLDGALRADHLLNFDKGMRGTLLPEIAPPFQSAIPWAATSWLFMLDDKRIGSSHYFGPQAGLLGLGVDINPTGNVSKADTPEIRQRDNHLGGSTGNSAGTTTMMEPGMSIGYTFLNRNEARTTVFSLGISKSGTTEYLSGGASIGHLPFRVPGDSPPPPSASSFYVGARLKFSW